MNVSSDPVGGDAVTVERYRVPIRVTAETDPAGAVPAVVLGR